MTFELKFLITLPVSSGLARGTKGEVEVTTPNDKISWCLRNVKICNNIDTLEGSFEIASVTAPFYLKKGVSLFQKGVSRIFKWCCQKILQGAPPSDLCHSPSFYIGWYVITGHDRGLWTPTLSSPLVALPRPHPICPLSLATPILAPPKDETLATPLPVAT